MSQSQRKDRFFKWSHSKMKVFESCREKFFRQYVLYEETPGFNNVTFLDGNVLQNLFEHWINYRFYKSQGEKWLMASLPNYYWKHAKSNYKPCRLYKDDTHEKHIKALQKMVPAAAEFFKPFIQQGAEIEAEVELNYIYKAVNVQINGKIDFLIRTGDGIVIADLKAMKKGNKFIDNRQLVFYNLLLTNLGQPLSKRNVFFTAKDSETEEIPVTMQDVKALEDKLGEYTKIVRSYAYRELNVGNECYHCPFKPSCWAENNLVPTGNRMEF